MAGTKSDLAENYPISTRVKFITRSYSSKEACKDNGKIGKIVGFDYSHPLIFLPKSKHISYHSTKQRPVSWQTGWDTLEILLMKNRQLEFDFMEK